jgi:hypothetical protein
MLVLIICCLLCKYALVGGKALKLTQVTIVMLKMSGNNHVTSND